MPHYITQNLINMIKYYLVENLLNTEGTNYLAKAVETERYDINQIVQQMLKRGSSMTEADIRAVLHIFFDVVKTAITEGKSINTELFSTKPSITGVFQDMNDIFNVEEHKLHINLRAGKLLMEAIKEAHLEKVATPIGTRSIREVKDLKTGSINDIITPGRVIEIYGDKIKLIGDNIIKGLILTKSGGSSYEFTDIISNEPKRIIAQMPDNLKPGNYKLYIETKFSGTTKPLKSYMTIPYDGILRVRPSSNTKEANTLKKDTPTNNK